MKSIEENTEKLDLLERTVLVEEKQKNRLKAIALEKEREIAQSKKRQLLEGHAPTSAAMLDEEDNNRRELLDAMNRDSNPSNGPVVKVLSNVHGN